jgi:hypothetical protein
MVSSLPLPIERDSVGVQVAQQEALETIPSTVEVSKDERDVPWPFPTNRANVLLLVDGLHFRIDINPSLLKVPIGVAQKEAHLGRFDAGVLDDGVRQSSEVEVVRLEWCRIIDGCTTASTNCKCRAGAKTHLVHCGTIARERAASDRKLFETRQGGSKARNW